MAAYATVVNTITGEVKEVGRLEANRIIKKAENMAIKAMKKYEGEVVLYGIIHKDKPSGMEIHLTSQTVTSKKYITSAFHGNKHSKPLFYLRKTKR